MRLKTQNIQFMNKKSVYVSPEIKAIDIENESVLCASTDSDVTVANIWEGNTEEEW